MEPLGKMLVAVGLTLTALGLLLWLGVGKSRGGFLPGDISLERGGFKFYFPIVTCLLISLLLSAILWLFSFLSRR